MIGLEDSPVGERTRGIKPFDKREFENFLKDELEEASTSQRGQERIALIEKILKKLQSYS